MIIFYFCINVHLPEINTNLNPNGRDNGKEKKWSLGASIYLYIYRYMTITFCQCITSIMRKPSCISQLLLRPCSRSKANRPQLDTLSILMTPSVLVAGADGAGLCVPGEARLGETRLVHQRRAGFCETHTHMHIDANDMFAYTFL